MAVLTRSSATARKTERKLVIVGDGGVGKSTLVRKLMYVGPNFTVDPTYVATLGVEVYPLTGVWGDVIIWDSAGQERFGGLRDGYWMNANAVIVMCNSTSIDSVNNVANHIQNVLRVSPGARVTILCNLFDFETKQHAPMSNSVQTILNKYLTEGISIHTVDVIRDSRDTIYNIVAEVLQM